MIGDFWYLDGRDDGKQEAAAICNVDYIKLSDLQHEEYHVGLNSVVLDHAANKHVVEYAGVAKHPNDEAMKIISDRVMKIIQ